MHFVEHAVFIHLFAFFRSKWGSDKFEYRTRASARRSRERAGSSVVAEWSWLQSQTGCGCAEQSLGGRHRSREKVAKLSNLAVTFSDDAIFLRLRIRWQNFIFAYPRQFSCYWHGERSILNVLLFWKCLFTYCHYRQSDNGFVILREDLSRFALFSLLAVL